MLGVLVYGFVNSLILALTAIGFSLTYGISRIPNFAHGAFYVLAGLFTWLLLNHLGVPLVGAMAIAITLNGLLGAALYRGVLVRVRGIPLAEVIVTFVIGIAALEALRYFGLVGANYGLPGLASGRVDVLGVPVDGQRLVIVVVGLTTGVLLWLVSHRTRWGLALRAIAQDEEAAMMVGVNADHAATLAVGLGAALAAVAAVVIVPLSYVAAEAGGTVLVTSIAVCIVGGLGSTMGVLAGSLLIGYTQTLSVELFGPHLQMIVALLAILITLIVRPSGLFGQQKALEERV